MHLSALTQYFLQFIPFVNFIIPIIIWTSKKDKSEFIDFHGKQIINFQLSILLYCLILAAIALPAFLFSIFTGMPQDGFPFHHGFYFHEIDLRSILRSLSFPFFVVIILAGLKIAEFILIIVAALNASKGNKYKYPLSIAFIK